MADKTTMLYNLRVKCAPMQSPEGDKRYWYSDAYGFTDDFGTPIEDTENGPYGPPAMRTNSGDTGRYAGSLVGVLGRMQGYDQDTDRWRRLSLTTQGYVKTTVIGDVTVAGNVDAQVTSLPVFLGGGYTCTDVPIGTSSDLIASLTANAYLLRLDVPSGAGNVWVNLSGNAAAIGLGALVTPTSPLTLQWPCCPNTDIYAIATAVGTHISVSVLSR